MKKIVFLLVFFFVSFAVFADEAVGEVITEPVGQPVNVVATILSTLLPLLALFTSKFPNVLNEKLTTIIGSLIAVGNAVYGFVNIKDLSAVDISGMVLAGVTALILFLSKDPGSKPKAST